MKIIRISNRIKVFWYLVIAVLTILVEVGYAWRLWSSTMIQKEQQKQESGNKSEDRCRY